MNALSKLSQDEQVQLLGLLLKGGDSVRRWVAVNRDTQMQQALDRLRQVKIAHVPSPPEVATPSTSAPKIVTEVSPAFDVPEVSVTVPPAGLDGVPPWARDEDGE